ncbi:MAG: hypothetical protein P9M14_05725 [Candidatus Alcyoniella australis]|nr:hypothetical protein [Candidatus Alcyoniella australis]
MSRALLPMLALAIVAAVAAQPIIPADNLFDPAWGTVLSNLESIWQGGEFGPERLVDDDPSSLWRAADGSVPPIALTFELARPARLRSIALANAEDADYVNAQARVVRLEALTPDRDPAKTRVLGSFVLDKRPGWQRFELRPAHCRILQLTILSNHGSRHMTTLAGIALGAQLDDGGPFALVQGRYDDGQGHALTLVQHGERLSGCTSGPQALPIQGRRAGEAWALLIGDRPAVLVLDADLRARLTETIDGRNVMRTLQRVDRDPGVCSDQRELYAEILRREGRLTLLDQGGDEPAALLAGLDGRWSVGVYVLRTGDAQQDLERSRTRAAALADELAQRGLDSSRVEVVGRGGSDPPAASLARPWRALCERIVIERATNWE